jgi:HK97 family phage prohead protease
MIQTRQINFDASGLQIREAAEGEESRTLVGYALKFGTRSVNLTPWSSWREVYEILEPGCISMEMLNRQDVVFTAFHNREKVLGRCTNGKGTLRMSIDSVGLRIECEMPNTELGNEMLELVKRGDLCGMSFAYTTDEDDSENAVSYEREGDKDGKEVWLRHVKRIDNVYDVTVASSPAYEDTEISQRELIEAHLPKAEAEQQREKEAQDKATVMKMRAKYYNTFNY